jgi:L-alanine-DL-glutamate epimerase-like enolase superfamily enzyme
MELDLLSYIRDTASSRLLTLRVDANGAFSPTEAMNKLDRLASFDLHSIEQPIPVGNWEELRFLCRQSPVPIALDEELIAITEKEVLLDKIQPRFIILKPTLLGGILETKKWIELADQRGIGWWMTSALESNIGLNAIAQLAATFPLEIPQGLGTGKLFHNNLDSPLLVHSGHLHYQQGITWEEPVDSGNH